MEEVEEVCDPEGELDAFDGVESLLEKSLLRQEEAAGGEPRYVMLETVHEYARGRLEESGEIEEIKRAHAEYFLALAEEAEAELRGPEAAKWLERLEVEHDNMRAALTWALEREKVELGLRLAAALYQFWWSRGYFEEGRRWLEDTLERDGRAPAARVKALEAVGGLADDQGDFDRAVAAAEEGLERISADDANIQCSAAAPFLRLLGVVAYARKDFERATRHLRESIALSREVGDKRRVASSLHQLGNVLSDQGNYLMAKESYEEALALTRELDNKPAIATLLVSMGAEFLLQGDPERGAALNEEAARLYREPGQKGGLQYALDNLGWAALMRGDHRRAEAFSKECLQLCLDLGDKLVAAEALEALACSFGARGETERVPRLFGAARTLREEVGYRHDPREHAIREPYLSSARSQLAAEAWERTWKEGRTMTLEEAVSYALEENGDR